ncbi:cysteine sulfinate desulfinase [Candidatus Aerophobetes bacterium]|uniref:Cysteine sulfinate desulfinase n=1 Tax=Aerophobetes bacterium TaxID=2030807 RepID=A0A2A4X7X1_UNCAE|nr:MAG: cysteine sulfinate desulfinase [Candidatus Aerophobetes bacterium]
MTQSIYLDNSASTQIAPEVKQAMLEAIDAPAANPSSIHRCGQNAKTRIEKSHQLIASFLNMQPLEIIFTSGGTESMNMLILGLANSLLHKDKNLTCIYSNLDHPCVLKPLKHLNTYSSMRLVALESSKQGAVCPEHLEKAIIEQAGKPTFITLSAVNSETGAMLDLEAVASIAEKHSTPLLIDGVALLGKACFSIPKGVSGMGFSSHKIHGPPGVGFIYKQKSMPLMPLLLGGNQMQMLRAGSENSVGIAGLSKAVDILKSQGPSIYNHLEKYSLFFKQELTRRGIPFRENGEGKKAPGILNLYFPFVDAETLLIYLDQHHIAISAGTACSSGALEPSYVLKSMGYSLNRSTHSVRFSLSRFTTEHELQQTASTIAQLLTLSCST